MQQEYMLKKHIEDQQATISIYSPILAEKERARRIEKIHKAATLLLRGQQHENT